MEETSKSTNPPVISCVIVTHNCREELETCLKMLMESARDIATEVLVVDNASSDGTTEMVRRDFPSVELISNSENAFFARANNLAISRTKGKYVVIMNPDVFVQKDTLPRMIEVMDESPSLGAASCIFVEGNGKIIPTCWRFRNTAWAIMSREPLVKFLAGTKTLRDAELAGWDRLTPKKVDVVSGAFMIARSSALRQVGLFDESFLLYYTDDDLCIRLHRAGFDVLYDVGTKICHLSGRSTGKKPILSILRIHRRDFVRYFRKHHGRRAAAAAWLAATAELLAWWLYLVARPRGTREGTDASE